MKKPVILYTTPVLAHPPIGGPELRVANSIKALSLVADVILYSRRSKASIGGDAADQFYKQYCCDVYYLPGPSVLDRVWRKAQKILHRIVGLSSAMLWSESRSVLKDMERVILATKPDILWLGFGNLSYPSIVYLKKHTNIPVICDTDSVWSRFIGREAPLVEDPERRREIEKNAQLKEKEEQNSTKLADMTTAVSTVDAEYYSQYVTDKSRIRIFSNVIDRSSYASVPARAPELKSPSVYIAGSFFASGCAMEYAARWFISEVLPLVKQKVSDVKIYIIGKGSDQLLKDINDPAVVIKGFVPSVLPYLCHADVVAVPLWFESGTRFKILEAGACRKAVVSTTLGAEGIPVSHDKDILIADDPCKFAEAVIRILQEGGLGERLGKNLYGLIQESFSIESHAREACSIYKDILAGK